MQVKSKLYKSVDLREATEESGLKSEEEVRVRLEDNLKREGFQVQYRADSHQLKVAGQLKDSKAKIYNKATELVKRTNQLYSHY